MFFVFPTHKLSFFLLLAFSSNSAQSLAGNLTERISRNPYYFAMSSAQQLILAVLLVATTSWTTSVTCKSVQPLKKEVWNELNCNKPQSRLAYLGKLPKPFFPFLLLISFNSDWIKNRGWISRLQFGGRLPASRGRRSVLRQFARLLPERLSLRGYQGGEDDLRLPRNPARH